MLVIFTEGRIQAAVNSFITVLVACILLMLVVTVGYYIVVDIRTRNREATLRKVREATGYAIAEGAKSPVAAIAMPEKEELSTRWGLALLAQAFEQMDEPGRRALTALLLEMGYGDFIAKNLNSRNDDYVIELVRMVGNLNLTGLDSPVANLLYTRGEGNIDLKYQAFLTLSRLGSMERMVHIGMDERYAKNLSFRSLQQILEAFSGDKVQLYRSLLSSQDAYVVRVCIKSIGQQQMHSLAGEILPKLASNDYNMVIDTVRTLGQLAWQPAADAIAACLNHARWEVRSVAVRALAQIDPAGYQNQLILALCDSEWQVRYSAGMALGGSPDIAIIRTKVESLGDRFALEMLNYMAQTGEMWRVAQ